MYGKAFLAEKLFAFVIVLYVFFLFRYRRRVTSSNLYLKKTVEYQKFRKNLQGWYLDLDKKRMLLRIIGLLILIFSGYGVYARLNPEKRFHRLIDGCETLVKEQKHEQAIIDMTNALKIRPDYTRGHYFLANLYLNRGDLAKAESALRQVVRLQADYGNAVNILKSMLIARKDSQGLATLAEQISEKMPLQAKIVTATSLIIENKMGPALAILQKAKALAPDNENIYQMIGDLQALAGRTAAAVDAYQKAVKLNFGLWQVHNALARLYLEQGFTEDALSELKVTRSLNPEFYLPALKMAQIYSNKGYFEGAAQILEDILAKHEGQQEASYTLGIVYTAMGKFQEAVNLFIGLPENYHKKRNYGYNLALAYYHTGKYEKAHQWLDSIKASQGLDLAGLKLLARVYFKMGQIKQCADILQTLAAKGLAGREEKKLLALAVQAGAKLRTDQTRASKEIEVVRSKHADLEAYLRAKDYESLIKGANKAIKENKFKAPFYNLLGIAYLARGKPEPAKKYLLLSYNEKKDNPMPLLNLTNVYMKTGAVKEAEALLVAHNRLFSKEVLTRLALGEIYFSTGRFQEAMKLYEAVLELNPQSFKAHQKLAVIHRLQGDIQAALKEYLNVLKLNPNDAISLNDIANIYAEEKTKLDTALKYAARAAQVSPRSGNIRDTLGWVHFQRDEFRQALSHFEAAYELNPYFSIIPYHLGLAQFKLERYPEAQKNLKLALNMKGPFREATAAKKLLEDIAAIMKSEKSGQGSKAALQ